MNLYRVKLRGLHGLSGGEWDAQTSYVVAPDAESAYRIVRDDLDKSDYGFAHERELDCVELIANEGRYPPCKTRLYLYGAPKP